MAYATKRHGVGVTIGASSNRRFAEDRQKHEAWLAEWRRRAGYSDLAPDKCPRCRKDTTPDGTGRGLMMRVPGTEGRWLCNDCVVAVTGAAEQARDARLAAARAALTDPPTRKEPVSCPT